MWSASSGFFSGIGPSDINIEANFSTSSVIAKTGKFVITFSLFCAASESPYSASCKTKAEI